MGTLRTATTHTLTSSLLFLRHRSRPHRQQFLKLLAQIHTNAAWIGRLWANAAKTRAGWTQTARWRAGCAVRTLTNHAENGQLPVSAPQTRRGCSQTARTRAACATCHCACRRTHDWYGKASCTRLWTLHWLTARALPRLLANLPFIGCRLASASLLMTRRRCWRWPHMRGIRTSRLCRGFV